MIGDDVGMGRVRPSPPGMTPPRRTGSDPVSHTLKPFLEQTLVVCGRLPATIRRRRPRVCDPDIEKFRPACHS